MAGTQEMDTQEMDTQETYTAGNQPSRRMEHSMNHGSEDQPSPGINDRSGSLHHLVVAPSTVTSVTITQTTIA